MNAKELQIGDLVDYRGKVIKVTSLYAKGGSNEVGFGDREDIWVNGRVLNPIPLTPEILEKNGFYFGFTSNEEDMAYAVGTSLHKEDEGWVWDEGNGAIKVIFPNESDGGEVKLEDSNYLAFVFDKICVHQLQQLIRLSGIDKEITLA